MCKKIKIGEFVLCSSLTISYRKKMHKGTAWDYIHLASNSYHLTQFSRRATNKFVLSFSYSLYQVYRVASYPLVYLDPGYCRFWRNRTIGDKEPAGHQSLAGCFFPLLTGHGHHPLLPCPLDCEWCNGPDFCSVFNDTFCDYRLCKR